MSNNKKIKITALTVLAIMLALLVMVACACSGNTSDEALLIDYEYQLDFSLIDNGTAYSVSTRELKEIKVKADSPLKNMISIPSTHNGKPVSEVANEGFSEIELYLNPHWEQRQIDEEDTHPSKEYLEKYPRQPQDIDYLPYYIEVPESVKIIGDKAFYNSMVILSLHDGITSIGKDAYNWDLLQYETENEVNTKFRKLIYPILTENGTISNRIITVDNYCMGMLRTNYAGAYFGEQIDSEEGSQEINIPEGITLIADGAFEDTFFSPLYPVVIKLPESLKNIGKDAFRNAGELSEINIPDSIENLPLDMFYGVIPTCVVANVTEELCYRLLNNLEEMYFGRTGVLTIEWSDRGYVDDFRDYILYIPSLELEEYRTISIFAIIMHEFRHYYQFIAVNGFEIFDAAGMSLDDVTILGLNDLLIKPTENDNVEDWHKLFYDEIVNDIWIEYYLRSYEEDARDFVWQYTGYNM